MKTTSHSHSPNTQNGHCHSESGPQTASPAWLDYQAVQTYLAPTLRTPGMEKMSEHPIVRRDGRVFHFAEDVCRVTEELQRRGLRASHCTKAQIMAVAVEMLHIREGYRRLKKRVADIVVAFRLPAQGALCLDASLKKNPVLGVKSRNQLARKIVTDFMTGKVVYRNPADLTVDFYALGLEPSANPVTVRITAIGPGATTAWELRHSRANRSVERP